MALQIIAMVAGLLLVGGASLWGLNGLHQEYGSALQGYAELRHVYTAGSHLATANTLLGVDEPAAAKLEPVSREVHAALAALQDLDAASGAPQGAARDHNAREVDAAQAVRDAVAEAAARLAPGEHPGEGTSASQRMEGLRESINRGLAGIAELATEIRASTEARQRAAAARRRQTIDSVGALAGVVTLGVIVIGIIQYRSVLRPLNRLADGVRRISAGQFDGRVEGMGRAPAEFVSLAADFNRMAGELDSLYRDLERKVESKSRELVRSERLASVGFLAAGVAHEINNPLGIISGYAEYSMSELEALARQISGLAPQRVAELSKNLRVICDEAFRCKEITGKLLSLARRGMTRAPGLISRRRRPKSRPSPEAFASTVAARSSSGPRAGPGRS